MIKTIIKLKTEINEQHYHDKAKPVYVVVSGERYNISQVDEYDDEVLIQTMPIENGGEAQIMDDLSPEESAAIARGEMGSE